MAKTQDQIQLKGVGSNHKDPPDVSLPVHALSDPTARMSWVEEPELTPVLHAAPLLY